MLQRRQFLQLAAGAAGFPATVRLARAQPYPARPVRVIVGQAAGSSSDITARLIGQFVSERLGQQFVIEVRPGAAGNIATEAAVNALADGYTILLVNAQNDQQRALRESQLQFPARYRAGRRHRSRAAGHGGQSVVPGQYGG
jgi:tripartite-type tricarboxylate transporter receptor subunit TctC